MTLNIKNPKAYELAQRAAALTGLSLTQTIIIALQHEIEREMKKQENIERTKYEIREMVAPYKHQPPENYEPKTLRNDWENLTSANMDEFIYDKNGLPG